MNIKYPAGIKNTSNHSLPHSPSRYGNRGMYLEELINQTNQWYLEKELAVIHKKPTPIQIVQVDYPRRSAAKIKEAYFKQSSTTDYNGVYRGYYLDFEAKETKNKTGFPLRNLHAHQLTHMEACLKQGGLVFLIFYFSSLKEFYLLGASELLTYLHVYPKKSSIPLEYIQQNGFSINMTLQSTLDYLSVIDVMIHKEKGDLS